KWIQRFEWNEHSRSSCGTRGIVPGELDHRQSSTRSGEFLDEFGQLQLPLAPGSRHLAADARSQFSVEVYLVQGFGSALCRIQSGLRVTNHARLYESHRKAEGLCPQREPCHA